MNVWQQISIPKARIDAYLLFLKLYQVVRELCNREDSGKVLDCPNFNQKPSGSLQAKFDFLGLGVLIYQDGIDSGDTSMHPVILEVHLIIQEPLVEVSVIQGLRPVVDGLQGVRGLSEASTQVEGLLLSQLKFLIITIGRSETIGDGGVEVGMLTLHGDLEVLGRLDLIGVAQSQESADLIDRWVHAVIVWMLLVLLVCKIKHLTRDLRD